MSRTYLAIRSILAWPLEIGRTYKIEGGPYEWRTGIGIERGECVRSITLPDGYECDLFTGVPNLRMEPGEGVRVSYRCLWGWGWRRRLWVSMAAPIHDRIYETARDDQGRWITFDEAQAIFREILHAEGWRIFRDLYHWGVRKLALSRALWNRHDDGRPRA
jgi:hypothetical protein